MRARDFVLGFAAAAAIIIGAVGAGCGGTSDAGPTADASTDVTVDHQVTVDAAPDTVVDAPTVCAVDADLTTFNFDAGADGGACISCVKSQCPTEIAACNMDCTCKSAFVDFINCTGMGGSLQSCAGTLSAIDPTMFYCAFPCASTCGVNLDAGRDAARDVTTDAPADGG